MLWVTKLRFRELKHLAKWKISISCAQSRHILQVSQASVDSFFELSNLHVFNLYFCPDTQESHLSKSKWESTWKHNETLYNCKRLHVRILVERAILCPGILVSQLLTWVSLTRCFDYSKLILCQYNNNISYSYHTEFLQRWWCKGTQ